MQLRRKQKEGAEVFVEALNDIMFFLLLFFLIISTMSTTSKIKVNLPTGQTNPNTIKDKVVLAVTKDRNFFINGAPIRFDILETTLKTEATAKQTDFVRLDLDQELSIQDLTDVLQIGSRLNLKMVIAMKGNK